ncbi:MAG: WD40 repeat domain-containing protein, partial [Spirillospora sp.]
GVVAVRQGRLALSRQHEAQSRELAGRARLAAETDPVEATRLAVAAYRQAPTTEARDSLLSVAATTRFKTGLREPTSSVSAVALSPDATWLAVASAPTHNSPGEVEIWSTLSGTMVASPDQERVNALAFSPDGRRLVTGGPAGDAVHALVTVWDLTSRRRVAASTIPATAPVAVAFDAAGRALAATSSPARLWDVTASTPALVTGRGALPPGLRADESLDGRIHVRTVETERRVNDRTGPDEEFDDPKTRVITSPTAVVDRRTGERLWTLGAGQMPADITAWHLSGDGRVLYVADAGHDQIMAWDLVRRADISLLDDASPAIEHLAASMDGRLLVSVSREGAVEIHDLRRYFPLGHTDVVDSLAYSADGRTLASVSGSDSQVHLRDPATHRLRGLLPASPREPAYLTDLARDPRTRGLTFKAYALRLLGPGGPGARWNSSLSANEGTVAVNPAGTQLAYVVHGFIEFFDVRSPDGSSDPIALRDLFPLADEAPRTLSYSPDGKRLAVLNSRGQLGIWDVANARIARLPIAQPPPSRAVAFSPGGRFLALGGDDRTITLWDLKNNALWGTLTGHSEAVTSLAFSPDGRTLASGGADHSIITWPLDITTAKNRLEVQLKSADSSSR